MTPLNLLSITDLILACEAFFLSGLLFNLKISRRSSVFFHFLTLFFMAFATIIAGIDHGFLNKSSLISIALRQISWIIFGFATLTLFLTTTYQIVKNKFHKIFHLIGIVQLFIYIFLIVYYMAYEIVMINYSLVALYTIILHAINLKKNGVWEIMVSFLIIVIGTIINLDWASDLMKSIYPLDNNSIYHIIIMISVVFFYMGGYKLKKDYDS